MSAIHTRSVSTPCAFPSISRIRAVSADLNAEDVRTYNALKSASCGDIGRRKDAIFVLEALSTLRESLDASSASVVTPADYDRAARVLAFMADFIALAKKGE